MEQSSTPAPKAKGKTGLTAAQIKAQEEAEERKRFYENLKNSRGGQKPFTEEDMKMFKTAEEQAQDVPVPYPFLNDDGNRNYINERFTKKPPRDGIIPADRKMIVTEYSLDHWLAQSFKLNLENIPPVRPSHIPKSVYEQLKKYIKYGNVNYDAAQQQQQQAAKLLQQQQRTRLNKNKANEGESPLLGSQSEKKSESQHNNRPHKYTIIIYPKSMKVKPVVDIIEEKQGINHSDTFNRVKDTSVTNNDNIDDKDDSGKEPIMKARTMSRSRNQNLSMTKSNFHSTTNGPHHQTPHKQKKMLKLPNYKIYSRPKRNIRDRVFSDNLDFLNPTEIEMAATSFDKYLTNMRNIHSQQQSSSDVQQFLDNTSATKGGGNSPKNQQSKDEKVMTRRLNNFNSRRMSKDGNKMFLKSFQGNQGTTSLNFNKDRKSNDLGQNSIFNQNRQSTDISQSPYKNLIPKSSTQGGNFTEPYGSQFQKFSSPTSVGSPTNFDRLTSPRTSLLRSAQGTRIQQHLDQIKLTTIKSKFLAFRAENEINDRNEESDRLALIVNRNKNIQFVQNSPLPPKGNSKIFADMSPQKQLVQESGYGESFKDQFAKTTLKLQNHLFPANKSVTSKLLKTLETTNITEILEDKNIVLTTEEKAILSQRNHQRTSNIITQHLEDEIDEVRTGARDNISINMVEITMDFNELQKRINDMNNPVFWLQKAIQKLRVASVVAIEGAIDYYKQGLRITPQSEPLLYNIACSYERIGKYENAIRWFQHVIDITPKHADSLYGLALSNFKLTRYETAIPFIKKAIDYQVQETCLTKIEQMIYFRSLCYKKTGDKNKCLRDYESLRPQFIKNLNQSLVSYVFGILMLPLQEERKLITNFIENFNELLIFYKNVAPSLQSGHRMYVSQFCNTKKQQRPWKFDFQKYKLYIYYYLSKKSFFKRIPTLQVFSKEIEESLVNRYIKNELVLIPSGYVGVVLVGTIFVLSHAELDIMKPRLLFKCNEGSIIGNENLDNGVSSHSETWLLAYENSEIIFFKKEHFQRIWDHQRLNTNRQIVLSTLQKNLFFYHLNLQLKFFLVYEMLQERFYMPGEIVVHQSKRSFMNKLYRPFFEDRISRLRLEIENKKMSTEANTGKKQSELGSLMAVFKETHHIKKQIITNSNAGLYARKDDNTDPYLTLRHQNPKTTVNTSNIRKQSNAGDNEQYHDTIGDQSDYKGGTDSNVQLLFDNQVEIAHSLIPQCADQDEEYLGVPYCQGIYVVHSGQINVMHEGNSCFTLKNGDSFGESVIIKQPSFEYFGDLVAGPQGAKCYLFPYDVLRNIPFKIIIDLVDVGGFMRKKEGLMHILKQKYDIDLIELSKF